MRISWISGVVTAALIVVAVGAVAVLHPETPLPRAWNPIEPLRVSDAYSPLTRWKLRRASRSLAQCVAALDTAEVVALPQLEVSDNCGISHRVELSGVGAVRMRAVETDCAVALRMALWERHDLQSAAEEFLGTGVTRVEHLSSFSCRRMRTTSGASARWSTHASGEAIDVSGFTLDDGTTVDLLRDWGGDAQKSAFLRRAQTSACRWFGGVLGPDFNSLHADHFHMQVAGRGFCR